MQIIVIVEQSARAYVAEAFTVPDGQAGIDSGGLVDHSVKIRLPCGAAHSVPFKASSELPPGALRLLAIEALLGAGIDIEVN